MFLYNSQLDNLHWGAECSRALLAAAAAASQQLQATTNSNSSTSTTSSSSTSSNNSIHSDHINLNLSNNGLFSLLQQQQQQQQQHLQQQQHHLQLQQQHHHNNQQQQHHQHQHHHHHHLQQNPTELLLEQLERSETEVSELVGSSLETEAEPDTEIEPEPEGESEETALNLSVRPSSQTGKQRQVVVANGGAAAAAAAATGLAHHRAEDDDLTNIRSFIERFKTRRGTLGLTQKQAAQCFRAFTNDRYAFSDNFVGHFEGFQFRPQTAMTIAPSLEEWLDYAERETRAGRQLNFMPGRVKETRKRKYEVIRIRDGAKRMLVEAFEKNKSPSTSELEQLSKTTQIPCRNIEIFFKNRRTSRQYHQ